MRLKVEIDDLTPEQWETAQRVLKASYDIPERADRMCLTIVHWDETRHVETPAGVLTGLSMSMSMAMAPLGKMLKEVARQIRTPFNPPDQCNHGSPVVKTNPSAFDNAPPIRTYEDGCQSWPGPYSDSDT